MSRCRGCPAEITYAPSLMTGNLVPLTRVTHDRLRDLPLSAQRYVYRVEAGRAVPLAAPLTTALETELWLNHFVDCAARASFRRRSSGPCERRP